MKWLRLDQHVQAAVKWILFWSLLYLLYWSNLKVYLHVILNNTLLLKLTSPHKFINFQNVQKRKLSKLPYMSFKPLFDGVRFSYYCCQLELTPYLDDSTGAKEPSLQVSYNFPHLTL